MLRLYHTWVDKPHHRELNQEEQIFLINWASNLAKTFFLSVRNTPIPFGPAFGKIWQLFPDGLITVKSAE